MKNKILYSALLAIGVGLIPATGFSQNLNPTVEVSNSYVGKLLNTRKPLENMAVPDSLYRFDLDFDYSVFDNPYKGAYIFNPYVVDLTPQKEADLAKTFYLRAGAGYALRPTFDMIWSPKFSRRLKLNLYASHQSFIGRYKNIFALPKNNGDSELRLVSKNQTHDGEFPMKNSHYGFDMDSKVGVNGIYDWATGRITFDVAYKGLHNRDSLVRASYNGVDMKFRIHANKGPKPFFYYDVNVNAKYGADRLNPNNFDRFRVGLGDLDVYGTLGPKVSEKSYLLMDYGVGIHDVRDNKDNQTALIMNEPNLYGHVNSQLGSFYITPKYVVDLERWHFNLGVKLSTTYTKNDEVEFVKEAKSQYVYPDIFVGFDAIRNNLNIYLQVTGGDRLNDYMTLKSRNHFYNLASIGGLNSTAERFNAALGFQGNIAGNLKFNLMAGYKSLNDGLLDDVKMTKILDYPAYLLGGVRYQDYNVLYSDLSFLLDYGPVLADGFIRYNHTNIDKNDMIGFEPAAVSGNFRVRYNWMNRVKFGGSMEFATTRKGHIRSYSEIAGEPVQKVNSVIDSKLPAYLNLGLFGEYSINRKFSVWTRVDNLLNMTIQRVPLYPQSGISLTAGICLNL